MAPIKIRPLTVVLAIALIFVFDRAAALGYLLPFYAIEDERVVQSGAVKMARELSLDPGTHKYPQLLSSLVAGVYLGGFVATDVKAMIHLEGLEGFKARLATDPFPFASTIFLGRELVATLGAICLVVIYFTLRRDFGETAAVLAAMFTACGLGFLFTTLTLKNDVLVTLGALLTVAASLRLFERGRWRDYLVAGLAAGFCLAAKYHVVAFIPILVAHRLRRREAPLLKSFLAPELLLTGVAALAALAALSPHSVLDLGGLWRQGVVEYAIQNRLDPLLRRSSQSLLHLPVLFQLGPASILALGAPLYLLSVAGLVLKLDFRDRRKLIVLSYPAGLLAFMIGLSGLGVPHLFAPITPFVAAYGGRLLAGWIESERRWRRVGAALVAGLVFISNFYLFHGFIREEDRVLRQATMDLVSTHRAGGFDAALVPYFPNPDLDWPLEFYPQWRLTEQALKDAAPDRLLLHHAFYVAFLDNPEVYSDSSLPGLEARAGEDGKKLTPVARMLLAYLKLRSGGLGYREVERLKGQVAGGGFYTWLHPDLGGVMVSIYEREETSDK